MRKILLVTFILIVSTYSAVALASTTSSRPTSARAHVMSSQLATMLSQARLATAKYATSLSAAKAGGYQIITKMIPDMGYHFMNPKIAGFDVTKPPILVYVRNGKAWQLGALEWVFPKMPKTPPLPGAHYGAFAAACHYADGTFVPASSQ